MKDKYIGVCKVGEKGQIVIPKETRDMFNIKPGVETAYLQSFWSLRTVRPDLL